MALWQYTFQVLTRESFESVERELITQDVEFDEERYWLYKPIARTMFSELDRILKKTRSWSTDIDLYGDQESNCFEVVFDPQTDTVLAASFRIDFTTSYEDILRLIMEFCLLNGLIILDENRELVPFNLEEIVSLIKHAPQVKKYNDLQ
ncbi:MAG: hypothetical protein J7599_13950 [Niabella sp.]|nr:hypothetical protein [Niabella sp.]